MPREVYRKMKERSKYPPSRRQRLVRLRFTKEEDGQWSAAYEQFENLIESKCQVGIDGTCLNSMSAEHSKVGIYLIEGKKRRCGICGETKFELIPHKPTFNPDIESRPDNILRFLDTPTIHWLDEETLCLHNERIQYIQESGDMDY
jgi:hypothetical protein